MGNIRPDHREQLPKAAPGRTDAWLRRHDPKFLARVKRAEKREGQRRIPINKPQK